MFVRHALILLLTLTCLTGVGAAAADTATALPCTTCGGDPGGGGHGGSGGTGGGAPTLPPLARYSITWANFGGTTCYYSSPDQRLCAYTPPTLQGDAIDLTDGAGTPGLVTITLRTATSITWYKEVKAFDSRGNTLGTIATSDTAHGPVSMTLPAASVAALVFTKAGFLGIHVGQYDLRGIAAKSGHSLTFDWYADR